MTHFFSLLTLLFITGCSIIPQPGEASKKYVLSSLEGTDDCGSFSPKAIQLAIDHPTVYPPLDNTRIALKPHPQLLDQYADVEWADRLAPLIQDSVVQSLQNAGSFKSVLRPTEGVQPDYLLKIDVRRFWVDQSKVPHTAYVDYVCNLVKMPDRQVVATQSFCKSEPIKAQTLDSYIKKLDDTHLSAVRDIQYWLTSILSRQHDHRH